MTNVTAAIGVAQMENLESILLNKRETAKLYSEFFKNLETKFITEQPNVKANYWLNCIRLKNREERDKFLEETNSNGVMTRPIWRLMNKLEMYKECQTGNLYNSVKLEETVVNIPSGYRI